ncbi:Chitin deacetylase, partial [Termitomyces sp. T112]
SLYNRLFLCGISFVPEPRLAILTLAFHAVVCHACYVNDKKRVSVFTTVCLALSAAATPYKRQAPLAQVITRCTVPNTAALTFDDGPWVYLYDISKALVAANATGTFFFNGDNYECIYNADEIKRVRYAFDKGHQVASHTWAHKDLTTLTWDQIHDEMWRVE